MRFEGSAGMVPSSSNTAWLRQQVAAAFTKAHSQRREIAGIATKDVLALEGETVETYTQKIEKDQWASQIEIQLACEILKHQCLGLPTSCCTLKVGDNPKLAIKYHMMHWTLHRTRGVFPSKVKTQENIHRGGMHVPPTWRQVEENREQNLVVEINSPGETRQSKEGLRASGPGPHGQLHRPCHLQHDRREPLDP